MKRFATVGILAAAMAVTVGAVQPKALLSPTTDRLALLEAQVAELRADVDRLEGLVGPSPQPTNPPPTPQPTPAPTGTPTAGPWQLVWDDSFDTWDSTKYFVYGDSADGAAAYRDTQEQQIAGTGGFYDPRNITAANGLLHVRLYTDTTGIPRVAAFIPQIGGTSRGDLLSMAVEFRIRADRMVGYKGVPLLWPGSGVWPRDGEINWPESDFDQRPSAFMHRQDATSGSDQDWYPAPTGTSWQDNHVYRTEWIAGTSVKFFIDGQLIGTSTNRVPKTAMHFVAQFETNLDDTRPSASVAGNVQLDYLRVWRYAP